MARSFWVEEAQVHATLAAIAYAGDTVDWSHPSLDTLHTAINHQLNCHPEYATKTDWKLVWGPVVTWWSDNLMYVTMNHKTSTLAIVIRGTTAQALSQFEDVPRYLRHFPDPKGKARVSGPFLGGIERLLKAKDKWHDKNLAEFLGAFHNAFNFTKVVVSGHSQGASLVPLMMLALKRGLLNAPKLPSSIELQGYAIAPPTTGSPEFAKIVNDECNCWFVFNPKDLLPLGYNAMQESLDKGIPIELHGYERDSLQVMIDLLNSYVNPPEWAQPKQQVYLEGASTGDSFFEQIDQQHNANAYLTKLGVTGTTVNEPSDFPVLKDPKFTFP